MTPPPAGVDRTTTLPLDPRWSDIDFDSSVWTIPADVAKNGLAHRVPLSPLALELIETLTQVDENLLDGARRARQHREAVQALELSDLRPHDLRRTAAFFMASAGVSRIIIGKILNHVETGVTATYDRHAYDREKREALHRWSSEIWRIVEAEPA